MADLMSIADNEEDKPGILSCSRIQRNSEIWIQRNFKILMQACWKKIGTNIKLGNGAHIGHKWENLSTKIKMIAVDWNSWLSL